MGGQKSHASRFDWWGNRQDRLLPGCRWCSGIASWDSLKQLLDISRLSWTSLGDGCLVFSPLHPPSSPWGSWWGFTACTPWHFYLLNMNKIVLKLLFESFLNSFIKGTKIPEGVWFPSLPCVFCLIPFLPWRWFWFFLCCHFSCLSPSWAGGMSGLHSLFAFWLFCWYLPGGHQFIAVGTEFWKPKSSFEKEFIWQQNMIQTRWDQISCLCNIHSCWLCLLLLW